MKYLVSSIVAVTALLLGFQNCAKDIASIEGDSSNQGTDTNSSQEANGTTLKAISSSPLNVQDKKLFEVKAEVDTRAFDTKVAYFCLKKGVRVNVLKFQGGASSELRVLSCEYSFGGKSDEGTYSIQVLNAFNEEVIASVDFQVLMEGSTPDPVIPGPVTNDFLLSYGSCNKACGSGGTREVMCKKKSTGERVDHNLCQISTARVACAQERSCDFAIDGFFHRETGVMNSQLQFGTNELRGIEEAVPTTLSVVLYQMSGVPSPARIMFGAEDIIHSDENGNTHEVGSGAVGEVSFSIVDKRVIGIRPPKGIQVPGSHRTGESGICNSRPGQTLRWDVLITGDNAERRSLEFKCKFRCSNGTYKENPSLCPREEQP